MENQNKQRVVMLACIGTLMAMCGVPFVLLAVISGWIKPANPGWIVLAVIGVALLWFGRKLTRPLIAFYKAPRQNTQG